MTLESSARQRASEQLSHIDPVNYGRTRNYLDGAVTRLSSYLRHGVLSLAEVRDAALKKANGLEHCLKFMQELAWRDYHQRVWRVLGKRIWSDIEPYKTGFRDLDYADALPADVLDACSGVDYIDHFVEQLHNTGYLHNHARMWIAAYVVHARRVKWQAGARWFLSHLLDGDEASNNLSWQWCASTFSHKPYIFNRESVTKFTGNAFDDHQSGDPFDGTYESISQALFRHSFDPTEPQRRFDLRAELEIPKPLPEFDPSRTLVWVHDGMMSPAHVAVHLGSSHIFLWDDAQLAAQKFSAGRIAFQRSALFCPDVHSHGRPIAEVLLEIARAGRFETLVTGETADPRLLGAIERLSADFPVEIIPDGPFVELNGRLDLARFSRYWAKVEKATRSWSYT